MNIRRGVRLFFVLTLMSLLVACRGKDILSGDNADDANSKAFENNDGFDEETEKFVPLLDEFDPNMSQAHFISAPDFFELEHENSVSYDEGFLKDCPSRRFEKVLSEASASGSFAIEYKLYLENTDTSFIFSDGNGEYGNNLIMEFSHKDGKTGINFGTMKNGVVELKEENAAYILDACTDNTVRIEVVTAEYPAEDTNDKNADKRIIDSLKVYLNGETAGYYYAEGAKFIFEDIGFFKDRDVTYSYVDDIKLIDMNGNVICLEDFSDEDEDIFEPYYTKIVDGRLRIGSGVTLTRIEGAPAPMFCRSFALGEDNSSGRKMENAFLYLTALGSVEAYMNGERVSSDYLSPGSLNADKQLEYVSYDVTELIRENEDNQLQVLLLHGWYDRAVGHPKERKVWGNDLALKGELVIRYEDGSVEIIPTDDSFEVTYDTDVRFDDIYQGEMISALHEKKQEDMDFHKVLVDRVDNSYLDMDVVHMMSNPIRAYEKRKAISVTNPSEGVYVYDFGQNASGIIEVDLEGARPEREDRPLIFRYGETINTELMSNTDDVAGTIWTQNLLSARATDYYFPNKEASKDNTLIEFSHTQHGFRYLQIDGLSEPIDLEKITMKLLSSNMKETGTFTSSNDLLNRYFSNAKYSVRSNMLSIPSDCNQRDERLGWAGDAQNVSAFSMYSFDSHDMWKKYLEYLCQTQSEDGAYKDVAPVDIGGIGNACWGDAPLVIAWNMYLHYADKEVLERHFDSFKAWVDYLVENSNDYVRYAASYGDHLSTQGTPNELSDTAWCAHSADLLSRMAGVLNKTDEEEKYRQIYENFRSAWQQNFIREDASLEAGILAEESETGYALGIAFGLFEDSMLQMASDRLAILCDYSGYAFHPGYSGMTYFLSALSDYGHADTAMKVLENQNAGSLLFTTICGMTTTPESLEAYTLGEDGLFRVTGSLNHYAYASPLVYLYNNILGIKPDEKSPGYEHFILEPKIAGSLSFAEGSLETKNGIIKVRWDSETYDESRSGSIKVTVPKGSSCSLILPNGDVKELKSGEHEVEF